MLRAAFIMAALEAGVPFRDVQTADRHPKSERDPHDVRSGMDGTDAPVVSLGVGPVGGA